MDAERGPLRVRDFEANGRKYELLIRAVANGVAYYDLLRDGAMVISNARSEKGETDDQLLERLKSKIGS